jgi:HEAT repeat protein
MPDAAEIIAEARRLEGLFEKHWILPWHESPTSSTIWRHRFVHLLVRLPDELFDQVMQLLLEERSFALRGLALHLVRMRDRHTFAESAMDLLQDPSVHVRALSAMALGQFGGDAGLDALLETKDGEHAEVKKAVVDAMRRIRDVRCIPLLARWVGRVGEDDDLRRKSCEALADIGDEAAMPVLVRVLQDNTAVDEVRGEAARAIGMIGVAEAHEVLTSNLDDARPWVRARCTQGLGLLGSTEALPRILPFLEAGNPWMVRTHAVEAVARLAGTNALSHVLPLTSDQEARIRSEACVALGTLDCPEARKRLHEMLNDPEMAVRIQALDAFSRSSGQDFGFRLEDHAGSLDTKALEAALAKARAAPPPPADTAG